jgi:hypothetical protein
MLRTRECINSVPQLYYCTTCTLPFQPSTLGPLQAFASHRTIKHHRQIQPYLLIEVNLLHHRTCTHSSYRTGSTQPRPDNLSDANTL